MICPLICQSHQRGYKLEPNIKMGDAKYRILLQVKIAKEETNNNLQTWGDFTNMDNPKNMGNRFAVTKSDQVDPSLKQRSQSGHPDKTPAKSMARVRCVFPAKRSA